MFTIDSRSEKWLDLLGPRWNYANDTTFSMIKPGWRDENLGRGQPLVQKAIEEYRTLMERGSAAPAPILWRRPGQKLLEVLDGIQRLAAAEDRNLSVFNSYIITTDSEILAKQIRVFANYRLQGGYQESAEWTLERAITLLVATGEMSVEDCAELGGWTVSQVRDKAMVVDYRFAILAAGGPERLPDTTVKLIAKNANKKDFDAAPAAISKFTNAIKRMGLSAEEATPHVEEFFAVARSRGKVHDQFEKKWKEFCKKDGVQTRLADPSRSRYQPMTPEGRLLKGLKGVLTTTQRTLDDGDVIADMDEYIRIDNQIRKNLLEIQKYSRGKACRAKPKK